MMKEKNEMLNNENEKKIHEEKTYLTWVNKIGYGSGDIAGNVVYALLSAFVMIFLTDTVPSSLTVSVTSSSGL